jgi:hypothetical protein
MERKQAATSARRRARERRAGLLRTKRRSASWRGEREGVGWAATAAEDGGAREAGMEE